MAYDKETVLDGTIPTLDASELSYEFEKARIKGSTDSCKLNILLFNEDNARMSHVIKYLRSWESR